MPKISFVIPTKNRVSWLGECLTSLSMQSEKDIEIIVINDGSTDETGDLLSSEWIKSDHRIKVITHDKSEGAGASRNEGTALAQSDIVCQMDDDDIALAERAEKTLEWFKFHPDSEMVNFPYVRISMLNEIQESFPGEEFNEERFKKDGYVNYWCNPSAAYKRESFLDTKGYQKETPEETDDYGMIRNWMESGKKIDFCPGDPMILHRVLPESMMSSLRGWDGK